MNLSATANNIAINGGNGWTVQSSSVTLNATDSVALSSSVSTVALEASGTFTSNSNFIDLTGQLGVEIQGSSAVLNAYAVVDALGDQLSINAADDVSLSTANQNIRFDAATTIAVSSGSSTAFTAVSGATLETTSDSESNIVFSYVVGLVVV